MRPPSYLNGTLYTKDEIKGAELIKLAATNHNPEAQAMLGVWLTIGLQGYPKDEVLALTWIKAAAEKGNTTGLLWQGVFYENGKGGITADLLLAMDSYKKAAAQGNVDAKIAVGRMYALGRGVSSNGVEALKYLRDAASFNAVGAYPWIASVYEFGRGGVPKNGVLAYAWYSTVPATATAMNVKSANEGKERLSKVLTSTEQSDGEKMSKTVLDSNRGAVLIDMINTIQATALTQRKGVFGTGIVVADSGEILTNEHVIANCPKIRIMPANLDARVMSKDSKNDLALLKIEDMKSVRLPAVKFRSGRGIRLGDDVIVIGYPLPGVLSTGVVVTTGIVNALSGLNNDTSAFQMSATVQPGSSGGPVFDRMGNLVGVVRARLTPNMPANPQNINFAINLATTTGFLDAYNVNYLVSPPSDKQMSTADLTANAQKSTVQVECY